MQQIAHYGVLGGHRPFAHAGGVGLGHADHAVDHGRRNAGAGAHAAGGGVGRGDVWISAVINVEKCPLCALEQNSFFCSRRLVQHLKRVGYVWLQAAGGLEDTLAGGLG